MVTLPKAKVSPKTKILRAQWKIAKNSGAILRSFLEGKSIMPRVLVAPSKCCSDAQILMLRGQPCFLSSRFLLQPLPSLHALIPPVPIPSLDHSTACCLYLSSSFHLSNHLHFYPPGMAWGEIMTLSCTPA